jgi:hypothetical protein
MAQRPVPRGASFAYAVAEQSLDEQLGRIEALDAKAGIVIATNGVLAALLFGRSSLLLGMPELMSEAAEPATVEQLEPSEGRLPPPVPGGTGFVESLGRWVDKLLGADRDHRRVVAEMRPQYLRDDEIPDDPPPEEPPPLVPDGTGTVERGKGPENRLD